MIPRWMAIMLAGLCCALVLAAALQPAPTQLAEAQRRDIVHKVHNEVAAGEVLYNLAEIPGPVVRFKVDDPRNASETVCVPRDGRVQWEIRINERYAAANYHDYLRETIPHEVAHLLLCQLGMEWQGHGPQWATIVRDMGATPRPTHDYDKGE